MALAQARERYLPRSWRTIPPPPWRRPFPGPLSPPPCPVLDAVLGVADRGRQVVEREGVGVDLGGVEALLAHESFGAMGRALAFAADTVHVDVVAHDLRDIDRRILVREGGEADLAAAVDHAHRLVVGVGSARALEHIVDTFAAVEPAHRRNRVLPPD